MRTPMREWPLVLFTALSMAAAGSMGAAPLLPAFFAPEPLVARQRAGWAAALLVVGFVASLGHVARPGRLVLAPRRFGASALSTEVVLAGLVALGSASLALSPTEAAWVPALAWATGGVSVAFLATLGLVYRLRGQVTWQGAAVAGPLLTGLAYGLVACSASATGALPAALLPTIALLGCDAIVFGLRWARVGSTPPWLGPTYPKFFRRRHLLLGARLILVDLAPAVLLLASGATAADVSLSLGLLVDRIAFYGLAVQHTSEAEVARIEAAIGHS